MSGVNYYQLLGIRATATDGEVRRAYLRLSLQYHPDKRRTPDADADQLYRSIQEAYETLSCPAKRCLYDFVGCFAALAEVTASPPVAMPSYGSSQQRRGGGAGKFPSSSHGLWYRSSSGETLQSWGTSSLTSASRLSPCPSSDTNVSSSPGTVTGSSLGSGYLAATLHDPSTAISAGAAGHACLAGQERPACDAGGGFASLSPEPLSKTHHRNADHPHPTQEQFPRGPHPLGLELDLSAPQCPPSSPPAAAPGLACSSPITSPSMLLGKRRLPGSDDIRLPNPLPHSPQSTHPSHYQPQASDRGSGSRGSVSPSPSALRLPSADVHHRLLLTLEEMYNGCVKQLRLVRRVHRPVSPTGPSKPARSELPGLPAGAAGVADHAPSLSSNGHYGTGEEVDHPRHQERQEGEGLDGTSSYFHVEELFRVVVQPGWREGTKVTFPGKGDELPCGSRGDMVLVVTQAAHRQYERRGNDLHTVVVVPLVDALTGGDTSITTLDGRTLVLQTGPSCLQPFSERVLKGEGMPIPPGKAARGARIGPGAKTTPPAAARGDLHVRFEVSFPDDLNEEQKAELRQALLT